MFVMPPAHMMTEHQQQRYHGTTSSSSSATASSSAEATIAHDNDIKHRPPAPPPPPPLQQQQHGNSNMDQRDYDPNQRVYSYEQLQVLNLVVHPIWIFDYIERRMRWANHAGLQMWNANSLQELQSRNFQDISAASAKRMEEYLVQFSRGKHVTDQWTNYPNGKATTCHMNVSGIKFSQEEDHMSIMCEGVPLVKEELLQANLRGVEMIRHLPMAVAQFDMTGHCMFQNPEASLAAVVSSSSAAAAAAATASTNDENKAAAGGSSRRSRATTSSSSSGSRSTATPSTATTDSCRGTTTAVTTATVTTGSSEVYYAAMNDDSHGNASDSSLSPPDDLVAVPPLETTQSIRKEKDRPAAEEPKQQDHHHQQQQRGYHNDDEDLDGSIRSTATDDSINRSSVTPSSFRSASNTNHTHNNNHTATGTSGTASLWQRFVDPEIGQHVLEQIVQENRNKIDLEAMVQTRQGPKWSAIRLRKGKDPVTGEPVILYSATDKSDAIQAQKERKAREQTSEFLAIMAHEIRTPLHQVTGFIDLLDQTTLSAEQKSFVRLLKSSAQGLMTVISDVLDYSKLEAGKMKLECIPYEPLCVVEGSMAAVRASCEEKKLFLKLEWNKGIPYKLKGDPNRLRQILLNLLSNAVKFTKEGGISVKAMPIWSSKDGSGSGNMEGGSGGLNGGSTTTNDPHKEKEKLEDKTSSHRRRRICSISADTTPAMVRFEVTDTGMGVSAAHKTLIFRKYQQANASVARNFGGTGLGLSICQLLVKTMGGAIGVDSELGQGATFWVQLPVDVPTAADTTEPTEMDTEDELGSLHILVAEDNKINQKLLLSMLKRMGHTADIAWNGKEAIGMIEETEYDVVLMDIQMPVMDGLEATRRLRTMGYEHLPIYGLTASVTRSDYGELGFNDWIAKPIPMKDLKSKLYQLQLAIIHRTSRVPQAS